MEKNDHSLCLVEIVSDNHDFSQQTSRQADKELLSKQKDNFQLVYLSPQELKTITTPILIEVKDGTEKNVDHIVLTELSKSFEKKKLKQDKTGNKTIDAHIPSKSGNGKGKIDIICYNYFDTKQIDFIIENKSPEDGTKSPIAEAEYYAKGINKHVASPIKLIVGYNPAEQNEIMVKVFVNGDYKPLTINGQIVNYFFGKELLELVKNYPNKNEFKITNPEGYNQRDFHNLIEKLRTVYRLTAELSSSDKSKIDFTVAFISLKMILEKEHITKDTTVYSWSIIKSKTDITNAIQAILDDNKTKKYSDIFTITNDKQGSGKEVYFDFRNKLNAMNNEDVMKVYSLINELPPLHSLKIDLFGEAYEVLASKKTKSELGEYFTRRHIIKPLLKLFYNNNDFKNIIQNFNGHNPYKICDTSCGTGGFLTETFKIIEEHYLYSYSKMNINLSDLAEKTIFGYDINGTNINRTKINMYLAGDGFSDIQTCDTLNLPPEHNGNFDFIVTNVPYGKGNKAVDTAITNSRRLEVNFIIQIVKFLKQGGKALVIVPDGLLEAPSLCSVREWLLKNCKLNKIISLPKFAFAPYTKEKTYAIYIEKRFQALSNISEIEGESFWSYIIDNDGFANSDKRFETALKNSDGKWLHNELSEWVDNKNQQKPSLLVEKNLKEQLNTEIFKNEWDEIISGKKYGFIPMSKILDGKIISNVKADEMLIFNLLHDTNNYTEEENALIKSIFPKKTKDFLKKLKSFFYENDDENPNEDNEFNSLLEKVNIKYSYDDKCFYSDEIETKFLLNLTPEKYFREKEISQICLDDLITEKQRIQTELQNLLTNLLRDNNEI